MKVLWGISSSIATVILFGWTLVELYGMSSVLADMVGDTEATSWSAEANMLPLFGLLLLGLVMLIVHRWQKRKNHLGYKKSTWLPTEIEESDEREKDVTAKACRASYISLFYSFPVIAALMLLYPFVVETIPYYPVLIILLLPISQILVYAITWQVKYRA